MKTLPAMFGRIWPGESPLLFGRLPAERAVHATDANERFRAPFLDARDQRLGSLAGDFWRVRIDGASVAIEAEEVAFRNDSFPQPGLFGLFIG